MRRNRYLPLFTSFGLVCGVAALTAMPGMRMNSWFTWTWANAVVVGSGESTPLDAVQQASLASLRSDGALDNAALATVNLNEVQATTVLEDLATWFGGNVATAQDALAAFSDADARLRAAQAAAANGSGGVAAIPQRDAERTAAWSSWRSVIQQARLASLVSIGGETLQLADRVDANRAAGWVLPYAALTLNEQQASDLRLAQARYDQRSALRASRSQQASTAARFQSELTAAVGSANMAVLSGLQASMSAASAAVWAADEAVFGSGRS